MDISNKCVDKELYEIGDKIVYPMHGVGVIKEIKEKNILEQTKLYYIIEMSFSKMVIMIPVDMSNKMGLRSPIGPNKIGKAFDILQDKATKQEDDWKIRYSNNHEKVKRGSLFELAEVVRNLFIRNQIKELSNSEKKLFENALKLMVDEIALSKNIEKDEAEHLITEILEKAQSKSNNLEKLKNS